MSENLPAEQLPTATEPFKMEFDIGTVKHLGLQMYSTLPPVIGELVSNAWDADAELVTITVPENQVGAEAEIVVADDGLGMSDENIRRAYLIVGRDRREEDGTDLTPGGRRVMGRKGIGKFSAFGVADEIEIETVKDGVTSRFVMNFTKLKAAAGKREIKMPPLPPTGEITKGTRITLRNLKKYRNRRIDLMPMRRALSRRFSIIGPSNDFEVRVNGVAIAPEERDLQQYLERRPNGDLFVWHYDDVEIAPDSGWRVSGWIGATDRTRSLPQGVGHGIAIMARGKLVQEPFVFDAMVGQQFALSYLVGEITADFVDEAEDTVGTTRSSLVWDTDANIALKAWGQDEVNRIARTWAKQRGEDNEVVLQEDPLYQRFLRESEGLEDRATRRAADRLIRDIIKKDVVGGPEEQKTVIEMCIDFVHLDVFRDLAEQVSTADINDVPQLLKLFREWEVLEAKEMARVTDGRIKTITTLQKLIDEDALEVPTLHQFLREFPWVIDPRWNLVADEKRFSDLLREEFPEDVSTLEKDRRIDFLCVREGGTLVVVEIKRPHSKASIKELEQITEYVSFMRDYASRTTDPRYKVDRVEGYLLCGSTVDTWKVREKVKILAEAGIYVRQYRDLLQMVQKSHREFLDRYEKLREIKNNPRSAEDAALKRTAVEEEKAVH